MRVKELIELLQTFNEEEFIFLTINYDKMIGVRNVYKDDDGDIIIGS